MKDLQKLGLLTLQLPQVFSIQDPHLTSIEEHKDDDCVEHHELCSQGEPVIVEDTPAESSDSPVSGSDLVLDVSLQCSNSLHLIMIEASGVSCPGICCLRTLVLSTFTSIPK